jgi:hypothetical protein
MRRLVAAALTGTALASGVVLAGPAPASAATPKHIGVVVRYANGHVSAGCAKPSSSGLAVLEEHHSVRTGTQQYSGFVLQVDGVGTTRPDDTHYWSYWHSNGRGGWTYAGSGAASSHPKAGTVEGWSYVNGQGTAPRPPLRKYAALCGHLDPSAHTASAVPRSSTPAAPQTSSSAPPSTRSSAAPRSIAVAPTSTTSSPARHVASAKRTTGSSSKASSPSASAARSAKRDSAQPSSSRTHSAAGPAASLRATRSAAPSIAAEPAADTDSSGTSAWPTVGALAVVAVLGLTAWLVMRRRTG